MSLIDLAGADASRTLHRTMSQRETLRPAFSAVWNELTNIFEPADLDAWSAAVLTLVHVNAGPTCLMAFWDASRALSKQRHVALLVTAADAAADICRWAGAEAAAATLKAFPTAVRLFGTEASLARWWRALQTLASKEPSAVSLVAKNMADILSAGSIDAFENFIAAGLRASAGDKIRLRSFFTLEDAFAQRLVAHSDSAITFAAIEAELKAFVTALWGQAPLLRPLPPSAAQGPPRRVSIAGPLIRIPDVFRGVEGDAARGLFRATAAHAQAHLVLGNYPFNIGSLKPLQIALVNLIEDARIETLAMRELPGLRRLWKPYHVAAPAGVRTAPSLLARLARALFNPEYSDGDSFVGKGREMFANAAPRLHDPAISREIGMLLGNDLGQMRIQFNARSYIVEPVYRDDGVGLWDFGKTASIIR